MDRQGVSRWIAAYEAAWRLGRGASLDALFTPDAIYRTSPTAEPLRGRDAIARWWAAESDPAERWDLTAEVLALDGPVAVVRLDVRYRAPEERRYLDLWILRFVPGGLCAAFEEWYWAPPAA